MRLKSERLFFYLATHNSRQMNSPRKRPETMANAANAAAATSATSATSATMATQKLSQSCHFRCLPFVAG